MGQCYSVHAHWQFFKQEEELEKFKEEYKRSKQKKSTNCPSIIHYAIDGTLMLTFLL